MQCNRRIYTPFKHIAFFATFNTVFDLWRSEAAGDVLSALRIQFEPIYQGIDLFFSETRIEYLEKIFSLR